MFHSQDNEKVIVSFKLGMTKKSMELMSSKDIDDIVKQIEHNNGHALQENVYDCIFSTVNELDHWSLTARTKSKGLTKISYSIKVSGFSLLLISIQIQTYGHAKSTIEICSHFSEALERVTDFMLCHLHGRLVLSTPAGN